MQRVKLYGIKSSSILRVYKESIYFHKLCDAMEVCLYLNSLERSQKLNKTYMPFSTSLETLNYHSKLLDCDNRRDECEKSQLRHQLGIKNYKVFENSLEYFASSSANTQEVSSELVMS